MRLFLPHLHKDYRIVWKPPAPTPEAGASPCYISSLTNTLAFLSFWWHPFRLPVSCDGFFCSTWEHDVTTVCCNEPVLMSCTEGKKKYSVPFQKMGGMHNTTVRKLLKWIRYMSQQSKRFRVRECIFPASSAREQVNQNVLSISLEVARQVKGNWWVLGLDHMHMGKKTRRENCKVPQGFLDTYL